MDSIELYNKLVDISEVDDFIIELKPIHSSAYWGRYYSDRKLIRLYLLDENGNTYPEAVLLKEGLHELTHHIQYHHIPFWKRVKGVMHDEMFWSIYRGMLSRAFNFEEENIDEEDTFCIGSLGTEDGQEGENCY